MSAFCVLQTPTFALTSVSTHLRVLFFEKDYHADKRFLLTPKSFAHDEDKSDQHAIRKPQLPSKLRKSDFEVEDQRSTTANEKALFRQRARVLGREGFQACGKTSRPCMWGGVSHSADHSSGDIMPTFFCFQTDEQPQPIVFDGCFSSYWHVYMLQISAFASYRLHRPR